MKKYIMLVSMLSLLFFCPMIVHAEESTEVTTEESNEDIEIEVLYESTNNVTVKHIWKYENITYNRRCAIFVVDYPAGYKEVYLYGQKNEGTNTYDITEKFAKHTKTAYTKKADNQEFTQTGQNESAYNLHSNIQYYLPNDTNDNNVGFSCLISGYSMNSDRQYNMSIINNSSIPIFTAWIPAEMNGKTYEDYVQPQFQNMCTYLDTGINSEAPKIKSVKYQIDDAGTMQTFDVKVEHGENEKIMIAQKMTYHCFHNFKNMLGKSLHTGEFISRQYTYEFRTDRTGFGGGGNSHATGTEDNVTRKTDTYHQTLKLTGARSITYDLELEYDKFIGNIIESKLADYCHLWEFKDNRFFSKNDPIYITFFGYVDNSNLLCNVSDRYVELEYIPYVINEAGEVLREGKPYKITYSIDNKYQEDEEPDPEEPTEEPTTQEGSTIEYKDGNGINIVINNNPTFNNQTGGGGTGTGEKEPSFIEKLFNSLNEFWMGICTLINNITSSILKIINDSWNDFTKLFDEIMDSLKSGFGLLGEDGFLSLLAEVFSFIPEWIWKLFGAGIGITFLLVIIGMVVKIAT